MMKQCWFKYKCCLDGDYDEHQCNVSQLSRISSYLVYIICWVSLSYFSMPYFVGSSVIFSVPYFVGSSVYI